MGIDLFQRTRPDAELHPQFIIVRDSPLHEPARGLLRELQAQFEDTDGNFVEQFQTNGFDARTFELYLFGFLMDGGHTVDRSNPSPDFMITRAGITAAVEAVTANPPPAKEVEPYPAHDQEEPPLGIEELFDDVAIRMGSPLFSKLQKRYWELPHVTNRPLVIAIQDFHRAGSLMTSSTPLAQYLYGLNHHWYHDQDGKLTISAKAVDVHRIGAKEIPSGFFNQALAENISAVLFTNAGTIPKFNRLGHEGRYRSERVRMLRYGSCYRHDPNSDKPQAFLYEVGAPDKDPET